MELHYRDIDFDSDADTRLLTRWYNDKTIRHLCNLFPTEESHNHEFTPAYFQKIGQRLPPKPRANLIIEVDGTPIGEARFETDTPKLLTKEPHTAWLYLMIAEAKFRGRGLGRQIVTHLEDLAVEAGAKRMEIGIFAYNEPSFRLFKRLGYQEFAQRNGSVWWQGQMWADVRLLKVFSPDGTP